MHGRYMQIIQMIYGCGQLICNPLKLWIDQKCSRLHLAGSYQFAKLNPSLSELGSESMLTDVGVILARSFWFDRFRLDRLITLFRS